MDFSIPLKNRNDEGRGLVVFNSSDFLEIAMYKSNKATVGGASTLKGLEMMDSVTVQFLKNKLVVKNISSNVNKFLSLIHI